MAAIDFCSRAWPAPTKPGVSRASMIFRGQHPQGVRRWVPRRFATTLPQWWRENRAGAIFVGAAHGRDCLFVRGHGPLLQKPGCFASRFDRLRTGTARSYKTWSFANFDDFSRPAPARGTPVGSPPLRNDPSAEVEGEPCRGDLCRSGPCPRLSFCSRPWAAPTKPGFSRAASTGSGQAGRAGATPGLPGRH
jgi:hypothetical protein